MSEVRKIIIEVGGTTAIEKNTATTTAEEKPFAGITKASARSQELASTVAHALIKKAGRDAVNLLKQSVNVGFTRYTTLKEDYLAENTYDTVKSAIGKAIGFGASVAAGAKLGSALGPGGALAGAALGAGVSIASNAISYNQKMGAYYVQLNSTNTQIEFMGKRAGLSDNGENTLN